MKCTKPFILSYNRLFLFLELKGYDQLEEFWDLLEEAILGRLKHLAKTYGLVGMLRYWSEVLTDEGAEFGICLEDDTLHINIYECPSLKAICNGGEVACNSYCNHCLRMYPKALEPLGYSFKVITTGMGCLIEVKKCPAKQD